MEIELKENERIDDLEFKNLKIIQNTKGFCFGIDAVLLSDFAKNIKKNAKVLDLGTGNRNNINLIRWKNKFRKNYRCRSSKRSCKYGKKKFKIK